MCFFMLPFLIHPPLFIQRSYYFSRPLHNKMGITVPPTPEGFDDALMAAARARL